jgi:hypothetical protein
MTLLSREAILAAADLRSEEVAVPEWGGSVRVRMLTAAERDQFEMAITATKDAPNHTDTRSLLVRLTVCDEAGVPLFGPEDMERLGQKSAAAMDRVFSAATRINAQSDKAVDALGKDSASAVPDSTPTNSPSASA